MTTMPLPRPQPPGDEPARRGRAALRAGIRADRTTHRTPIRRRGWPRRARPAPTRTRRTGAAGSRRPCRCRCPGRSLPRSLWKSGADAELLDERPPGARDQEAEEAEPDAPRQRRRERSPWPSARRARGCRRGRAAGGLGDRRSSPRDRGARRPRCRRRTGRSTTIATRTSEGPVELAREREVVGGPAEPGQVGERGERRDGALVAIQDEAAEHDRAGDASRAIRGRGTGANANATDPAASARRPSQIA